ncbi:MAG: hypothetical protein QE495_08115 [Acidovorax sp.]|uniref:hypothetical protein n=1 Tax=Acidovorax sp. TaxID=1872122 RepID=UPI00260DD213|nr:hypothetical protein [Acidovorax sp.]MDH4426401.1 hypothetical protein [Acidovorax sp.]
MPSRASETDEQYFLEGLSSARAGLAFETCPYDYVMDDSVTNAAQICAPVNWGDGWKFGKFLSVQRARAEKSAELHRALEELFRHEEDHRRQCEILNRGLIKGGLKYLSTQRESTALSTQIRNSKQFRLLTDLYIDLYLPWRPDEQPYDFRVFDQLLKIFGDEEKTLRRIVKQYGEKHGVQAAWRDYVQTYPSELINFRRSDA